ncbi:peptidoglycan-associated lipoprotein precursor [mine drainage metagenome]|uniref:Peptidoglycan-associated lipoprotein n=1 Tax=mine drainage metagenome TaxID=410659 RepID=A0A1J5PKP4_9ZZZZ
MRNFVFVFLVGLFLTGCGSNVPLSNVPVADATATVASGVANTGTGSGSGVQGGGVAAVDLGNPGTQPQPSSLPHVIYFDYNSFVIKPEYQNLIADHVRMIKQQGTRKVAIEGHTDDRGGREYNLALGQKRAEAVVDALVILGIPKDQLEAVSFGKEKPAVVGSDEAAYSKNRRAEIRYQ